MGRCPRGERAGGEVEIILFFPIVILSDSEGSYCRIISKPIHRYLDDARTRLILCQLFRRAARYDRGGRRRERGAAGAKRKQGRLPPALLQNTPCKNNVTAPRSVRSPASTLRKTCSKSLKHRTREEGAGKGEFAFTECRNYCLILAQNRGFCAKEEPQAIRQAGRLYSACCEISLAATFMLLFSTAPQRRPAV